jgi:hypothetical protein
MNKKTLNTNQSINQSTKISSKFRGNKGKIDIPNTQIHDRSVSWFGALTSI